jgi:Holliday junction resolvasome RuvABC ATP-dependent DNA helicase subunit
MDRMERVDLQEYSEDELGKIVRVGMDDYKLTDEAVAEIATTLRGNPRAAAKCRDKITGYCDGNEIKVFTADHWRDLCGKYHILPLGLLNKELELLRILSRKSGTRLTELAAITCLSKGSIQKDYELFLMKQGLMEIGKNSERALTVKGREYLQKLDGDDKKS